MTAGQAIIVGLTTVLLVYSVYLLIKDSKKGKRSH